MLSSGIMNGIVWGLTKFHASLSRKEQASNSSKAGRWILRKILESQNLRFNLSYDPVFKFPKLDGLYCSLSHTRNAAVAVLSNCPVGIDIEHTERSVEKVLERISKSSERSQLKSFSFPMQKELSDPGLLLWTGKEAFSKALGLGMQAGFKNISLSFGSKIKAQWNSNKTSPHKLVNPELRFFRSEDYLICICSEEEAFTKPLRLFEKESPDFSVLEEN